MRSIARKTRDIFNRGRVVPASTTHAASEMPPVVRELDAVEMWIFFSAPAQRFLDGMLNAF
jgi:hypothetical protein